jgi:hypothetical protein
MTADDKTADALREARRAQVTSWVWWALIPVVTVAFWLLSSEAYPERAMFVLLADVSFVANAATYSGKQKAAEAKAASYENP